MLCLYVPFEQYIEMIGVIANEAHTNNFKQNERVPPPMVTANDDVNDEIDYYTLLRIPRSASPDTIKAEYHRALLRLHPDKLRQRHPDDPAQSADVGRLHDAFMTLSSATLRAAYDAREEQSRTGRPRPAQVVSLERFDCRSRSSPRSGGGGEASTTTWTWILTCRCGGEYEVTEEDLERGLHLVGCGSCSEVIWVGYEVAEEVDGGNAG